MVTISHFATRYPDKSSKLFEKAVDFVPVECPTLDDLIDVVTNYNWAHSTFEGSYRKDDRVLGTDLVVLDYDAGVTLGQATAAFKDYKHIIATSISHQKAKYKPDGSLSATPCDRFRVILFLETQITGRTAYESIWADCESILPGGDKSVKNIGRMWFPCKDVVSTNENGVHVVPKKAGRPTKTATNWTPVTTSTSVSIMNNLTGNGGGKGILFPDVERFLTLPWDDTSGDNSILFHAICNIKKNAYTQEECIDLLTSKGEALNANTLSQIAAHYNDPRHPVDPFVTTANRQIVGLLKSEYFYDLKSSDSYRFDLSDKKITQIHESSIIKAIGKQEYKERSCPVNFVKAPYKSQVTYYEGSDTFLNLYQPPAWRKANYFDARSKVPTVAKIPAIYEAFFDHLFAGDKESIDFTIQWMANSLKGKNICILSLVGAGSGIGKGTLMEILFSLHGQENSEIMNQAFLAKEFNQKIEGKTFGCMDEVSITNDKEHNILKAYANKTINLEGKGIESKSAPNYLNLMFTNNHMDCLSGINPDDNDRRIVVPMLTDVKLDQHPLFVQESEVHRLWNPEEPAFLELAHYLWHLPFATLKHWKSSHYYEVIRQSLPEWQRFMIEEYLPQHSSHGMAYSIKHLQKEIKANGGTNMQVGNAKIEDFCKKNSTDFAYKQLGGKPCVILREPSESISNFQARVATVKVGSIQIVNTI